MHRQPSDTPELVMEAADGDLMDWIMQQRGEISEEKARGLFGQILSGISHSHKHGILHGYAIPTPPPYPTDTIRCAHRDIKPEK